MTGNACNPASSPRFKSTMSGFPELLSSGGHDTIVPLVFLHPRNRRQFPISFRCLSFSLLPSRYGWSVSTISAQFSFVFIYYCLQISINQAVLQWKYSYFIPTGQMNSLKSHGRTAHVTFP